MVGKEGAVVQAIQTRVFGCWIRLSSVCRDPGIASLRVERRY